MPGAVRSIRQRQFLLVCALIVATCGLLYELVAATLASYLLGDSVTQFSLVIGVYLSAMGLGSWLSRFLDKRLGDAFINVQLAIALFGGFSSSALFLGFGTMGNVRPLLFLLLVIIGALVGLEIPLIMRLLPKEEGLKDIVARVLALDYLGALVASIAFPLLLLPKLGLVQTTLACGTFNAAIAGLSAWAFADKLTSPRASQIKAALVGLVLLIAAAFGNRLERWSETQLFDAPIIHTSRSAYQRITVAQRGEDLRLYLNGNLQFSSRDEHRYHEALVHPAMSQVARATRVLILGGGDGLAAREVFKFPAVQTVDLVDLDPAMTELFSDHQRLSTLNRHSLRDPRLTIHHADAMAWLGEHLRSATLTPYDVVIVDLPDPNNFSLGKLYTQSFYRLLRHAMRPDAVAVVQASSPLITPNAYWCIARTMRAAGLQILPYHAFVPAFGDWGFVLATGAASLHLQPLASEVERRYLDDETMQAMFHFPLDQRERDVAINHLNDQQLVHYYEHDLARAARSLDPV